MCPCKSGEGILYALAELICTFHAEPGPVGNVLQADAVGMIRRIAPIAQKKDVFMFRGVADWTRSGRLLLFLGVLVQPSEGVELGNLFLVLDFVGGQEVSCSKRIR